MKHEFKTIRQLRKEYREYIASYVTDKCKYGYLSFCENVPAFNKDGYAPKGLVPECKTKRGLFKTTLIYSEYATAFAMEQEK